MSNIKSFFVFYKLIFDPPENLENLEKNLENLEKGALGCTALKGFIYKNNIFIPHWHTERDKLRWSVRRSICLLRVYIMPLIIH